MTHARLSYVLRSCWTVLAVGLPVASAAQSPVSRSPVVVPPLSTVAIVDVTVIPMDTERVLSQQTVVVEGGRITHLGLVGRITVPANALKVDGRGKFLIPGLADMHVHLSRTFNFADRAMIRYLTSGITTIRNMDHQEDTRNTVVRLRDQIAAGEVLGPRIYTSGRWRMLGAGASIASHIEAYKAAGYDFIKVYSWDSAAVFDSVMMASRQVGLSVAGHVPTGMTVPQALAGGMRSLEHHYGYFDHVRVRGAVLDRALTLDSLAILTKKAGAWNCSTYFWWHPDRAGVMKALQDAGAGLLLGTDGMGGEDGGGTRYIPTHLAAAVRAGLTPFQALLTGTRNIAEFFGTLDQTGTITTGKRADLVLLSGNPLQDVWHTVQPAGVMVGGRWLDREELDRRVATLDPNRKADERHSYWYYVARDAVQDAIEVLTRLDGRPAPPPAGLLPYAPPLLNDKDAPGGAEGASARVALVDSLETVARSANGRERIFRLLARQLGESRTTLPPEQHALFDRKARAWMNDRKREGYQVEIAGVR